ARWYQVPRTRSSHNFAAGTDANFGFKSGTRIIALLVSLRFRSSHKCPPRGFANFGIGTLAGSLVLVALAGCKPGFIEEREPWRHEAEERCLKSGAVKESPSVVMLPPINGPGMCGADFPLKVSALGESGAPLGYADEAARPPGDVPQNGAPAYPRQPPPQPA